VTDAEKDVKKVNFSVPTGNFGDILAGYYSKRMGLPVGDLIVATNENDILHRFFDHGEYHREEIHESISPSMDICVSSNFERYLYHLAGDDATTLASWMSAFESTGKLTITGKKLDEARADFKSARADTAATQKVPQGVQLHALSSQCCGSFSHSSTQNRQLCHSGACHCSLC
jgi:threonine synthase